MPLAVRVVGIKALGNEFGMLLVLGKDDGLANAVATRHAVAACHERLQHLVHRIDVEEPLVDGFCRHFVGRGAGIVVVPLQRIPLV
ncbi:hypothetical protein, partial [Stenotrophomonas sp. YIM B06876]|uniref:hypothetical protein n=1 Tax=Stenotrophomonas sp. YIM B06876 TaxID=3060211 RepID=UPI0027388DD7